MLDNQASAHTTLTESAESASDSTGLPGSARESSSHVLTPAAATVPARLAESLDSIEESADPVAALDKAVQAVADELSPYAGAGEALAATRIAGKEVEGAIEALVSMALRADDPVSALEEGVDSLTEALAARKVATDEALRAARDRLVDEQAAYRHARFHRVSELIDLGYSLDQAVAITNGNEAEIAARAAATGRHPMEPIYEYAVRNGYRPFQPIVTKDRSSQGGPAASTRERSPSVLAALAQMSDEAFAEATKGDRWQRLLRGQ